MMRPPPTRGPELVAIALDLLGSAVRLPVARRVDIGAARQEQPVHRGDRRVDLRGGGSCVDGERGSAVSPDSVQVEAVPSPGVLRFGMVGCRGERHEDARFGHRIKALVSNRGGAG
jgi:hypothetical protein